MHLRPPFHLRTQCFVAGLGQSYGQKEIHLQISSIFMMSFLTVIAILYYTLGSQMDPHATLGQRPATSVFDFLNHSQVEEEKLAMTTLQPLESIVGQRKAEISEL